LVRYYAFPVLIGLLCIAVLCGTVALIALDVRSRVRDSALAAQAAGTLPARWQGRDIDSIPPSATGIELSSDVRYRVQIADFIVSFWFIWAPLIMIVCIGTAAFFRKQTPVVDTAAGEL
jgi:hypothetical protein